MSINAVCSGLGQLLLDILRGRGMRKFGEANYMFSCDHYITDDTLWQDSMHGRVDKLHMDFELLYSVLCSFSLEMFQAQDILLFCWRQHWFRGHVSSPNLMFESDEVQEFFVVCCLWVYSPYCSSIPILEQFVILEFKEFKITILSFCVCYGLGILTYNAPRSVYK